MEGGQLDSKRRTEVGPSKMYRDSDFRSKPLIFADSPLLLQIVFGGCTKTQKSEDFRRKPQETADWGLSP